MKSIVAVLLIVAAAVAAWIWLSREDAAPRVAPPPSPATAREAPEEMSPDAPLPGVMRWVSGEAKPPVAPADRDAGRPVDEPGAATGPGRGRGPDAIPGEYVLSFYSAADRDAFVELAAELGLDVLDRIALGFSVRVRASRELLDRALARGPMPTELDANYTIRRPERPLLDVRRANRSYQGFGPNAVAWLGVPRDNRAWGRGVTVAVLDTGVNPHPALEGAAVTRLDLLDGDGGDPSAATAHGTAVASVIAGQRMDVAGIAPAAEILSVRVIGEDGTGDTFTVARGILAAVERGASVINISLGSRGDSALLQSAIAYALSRGAVVVASTGNDGSLGVSYPAAYPEVVAVPAVDAHGQHLYFSNRGEAVDLAAPGLNLAAAWTGGDVAAFSGTSAAAPLVSGAVAALLSLDPALGAAGATAVLEAYADDAGAPGRDPEVGAGIINMRRVLERGTPGIHDAALAAPTIEEAADSDDFSVTVTAQNRGTEPLASLGLSVDINGARYSLRFRDLAVGESAGHVFTLPRSELTASGSAVISAVATADGVQDSYPENNARQSTVLLRP